MASPKIKVETRADIGSNKVNKLRVENMIPGVIYKRGEETRHIQVKDSDFRRVYRVAGTTSIIDLELDGKTHPVIIKELQSHPVKNEYLHIDFQELDMDETLRVSVPINLINRENIKVQPSVLTQLLDEVEIECLPGDIPSSIDVDVSEMDFTTPIFVQDLDVAKDDKITVWTELDTVVCTLTEPSMEEEELEEDPLLEDAADVPLVSDEEEEEVEEE